MGLERGWIYRCLECGKEGYSAFTPNQKTHPECKSAWERKQRELRKLDRQRSVTKVPNPLVRGVSGTESIVPCSEIGTNVDVTLTKHASIIQTQEVNNTNTPKEGEMPQEGDESNSVESRRAESGKHPRRRIIPLTAEVEVNADELLELLREIAAAAKRGERVSPEVGRRIEELTQGLVKEDEGEPSEEEE